MLKKINLTIGVMAILLGMILVTPNSTANAATNGVNNLGDLFILNSLFANSNNTSGILNNTAGGVDLILTALQNPYTLYPL